MTKFKKGDIIAFKYTHHTAYSCVVDIRDDVLLLTAGSSDPEVAGTEDNIRRNTEKRLHTLSEIRKCGGRL